MILCGLSAVSPAFAQVDGTTPDSDTLYIIEEEVTYDTVYLYDATADPTLMSKEELLEAFRKDRGIGELYFQRGHMFLSGDQELFKLNEEDLKIFLTATQFADWQKAKRQRAISIPLYVLGGASVAGVGYGFYKFGSSFVKMAKVGSELPDDDELVLQYWKSAMGGIFIVMGTTVSAMAFLIPAIILSAKGSATAKQIAADASGAPIVMRFTGGPTPCGIGITISF